MRKETLYQFANFIAFQVVALDAENKSLNDFISENYNKFDELILDSDLSANPEIIDLKDSMKDGKLAELKNAIAKVAWRRRLVDVWAKANAPFELDEGLDPESLLEAGGFFNGKVKSEKSLRTQLGDATVDGLISSLEKARTNVGETQKAALKDEYYGAQFEPAYPSAKAYSWNGGGSTREYLHPKEIMPLFVSDHQNFLKEYDVQDQIFQPEKQEDAEPETA